MYLADRDIRKLLPQMELECAAEGHAFDERLQVQPCSVDLRVSNVFWRASRRRRIWRRLLTRREHTVDLRRSQIHDLDPLRDWKKVVLREGESLTLKPGHVIMGRIYERFRIPAGYAGKIEGRSSFARLGLSVHCTGDFINPGWDGFMPLQLYNAGPYPLRLTPFLPICQLMLVPLSQEPERVYGAADLDSKYVNDDGGPSLWWRDQRVRAVQGRLREVDVSEGMQAEVIDVMRFESHDVLDRFGEYVRSRRLEEIEHADALLQGFVDREDRRRLFDRIALGGPTLLVGAALSSVFASLGFWHYVVWPAALAATLGAFFAYVRRDGGYFGASELRAARNRPPIEA